MKIDFIGVGGAFYAQKGCNCAYIKEDNKILFIDFGLDTFDKVLKHNLLDNISNIYVLITHMHADHCGGLPTFIQYCAIVLNVKVNLIKNSETFKKDLTKFLELTAVEDAFYEYVELNELNFSYLIELKETTHTPLLECYSVVFNKEGKKTLYTGDSNDVEFLKEVINDESYEDVYTEISDYPMVHMDYKEIIKLDKTKITLMHIECEELYNRVKDLGYKIAKPLD